MITDNTWCVEVVNRTYHTEEVLSCARIKSCIAVEYYQISLVTIEMVAYTHTFMDRLLYNVALT